MTDRPILVVEDEPDGRELVARMLAQVDMLTYVTENAEQALQVLDESADFGAVVIDLALPGMDGLQLLETIRADMRWQDLQCIAITAYHTPELKRRALQSGFDGYFSKPLDRTSFLGALSQLSK
jgi:CheY-like chemotaxis protein